MTKSTPNACPACGGRGGREDDGSWEACGTCTPRPSVTPFNEHETCEHCGEGHLAGCPEHVASRALRSSGLADPYREAHDHYARQMSKKYYDDHEPSWDELDEDERMAWRAGFEMYVKSGGT